MEFILAQVCNQHKWFEDDTPAYEVVSELLFLNRSEAEQWLKDEFDRLTIKEPDMALCVDRRKVKTR